MIGLLQPYVWPGFYTGLKRGRNHTITTAMRWGMAEIPRYVHGFLGPLWVPIGATRYEYLIYAHDFAG